ncbi:MAG: endonuclease/exonuclease/phosphatase family protein [Thomasclavelia spiroformis]
MGYKIGSFNCFNFGRNTDKDINVFAEIINKENFDIIALQEIKGPFALNRILSYLSRRKWKGIADEISNDYAFIWNTNRFCLAKSEENVSRVYKPRIYRQYKINKKEGQTKLIRDPFYARFFPIGPSAPFIELRLINCHIRFNNNDNQFVGTRQMRINELEVLTKAIYAKEADKRYGNNRPAYTILLGDYNLNCRSSLAMSPYLEEVIEINDNGMVKRIVTQQDQLTTIKKNVGNLDSPLINNYDHFSYDSDRFDGVYVNCERIDAVDIYYSSDYEKYKKNVSDHLPIKMDLELRGD